MHKFLIPLSLLLGLSCQQRENFDASGSFEADEVIVSAETNGRILQLPIQEGDSLTARQTIGTIDVTNLKLQKEQREASVKAIRQKTIDEAPQLELVRRQLSVQESQLAQQQRERTRISNLVNADAATRKQLDDIDAAIDQMQRQMDVTRQQLRLNQTNISTQNRSILSEENPAEKSVAVIEDQISRGAIINPIDGVVLTQYAFEGEYATTGKPLYKIGNVSTITLRAYITGSQLPLVKLNQRVTVLVDDGKGGFRNYPGTINWISDKAEFTPKTIQTKDERANLVYAVKIGVKNDGYLKIGMYAELKF